MHLNWTSNRATGCLQLAWELFHRPASADPALEAAFAAPLGRLRAAFTEERVPASAFLDHLVPLSFSTANMRELAERALVKTIGRAETGMRLNRFHGLLLEIMSAAAAALPKDAPSPTTTFLEQKWGLHGTGLMAGIVNMSDPGVVVDSADVVMVAPVARGLGRAYLPYNLVCIANVSEDPAELPESMRLAWLLSMLNLDLPRYAEQVRVNQLATVAALAMLPITLQAAQMIELGTCDETNIRLAMESWLPFEENRDRKTETVLQWWDVYRSMRPGFSASLTALDQLLAS